MEEEVEKVNLIELLRTFKKEGLDNFIVIRKEKFENNYIPKSKVKEKIEEINNEKLNYSEDEYYLENEIKGYAMEHLRDLLRE